MLIVGFGVWVYNEAGNFAGFSICGGASAGHTYHVQLGLVPAFTASPIRLSCEPRS